MKQAAVVDLATDASFAWIAVRDLASGSRSRYTVYRIARWADKRADLVGRELDLRTARRLAAGRLPRSEAERR